MTDESKNISKETIKRLIRDVKDIIKNPLTDNGIYYKHDDTDMLKGYAMIVGPEDTPYFGGFYFFKFKYPDNYPHSPPKVFFCTNGDGIRFNPNLYTNGKVCVSLLNTWSGDLWTSCQTITTILLTLCTLLCENPLYNEPGITKLNNSNVITAKNYDTIIEYKNIEIAYLKMYNKCEGIYNHEWFDYFYDNLKILFAKNYPKILNNLEKLAEKNNSELCISINIYSMVVNINYSKLLEKMREIVII